MYSLYRAGATGFRWLTTLAGRLGHRKAKARLHGVQRTLSSLAPTPEGTNCYWMHCASVGEFEQGLPVWAALRRRQPDARFVLTFFSASGYKQFSQKPDLGEVEYLPWDDAASVDTFLTALGGPTGDRLRLALFVKYEWWLGFHRALAQRSLPYVVLSAAFRQNQPFFSWYGDAWRTALFSSTWLFVQDDASNELLKLFGLGQRSVSGDTRLDRVLELPQQALAAPVLEAWRMEAPGLVLVAGSTWQPDEERLVSLLHADRNLSMIVAPHEVDSQAVRGCLQRFSSFGVLPLSRLPAEAIEIRVVVVDCIGLLSRLYRLGDLAYIGGGFGAGIHNTLEPLAYRLPLAFGPKYQRFPEAVRLIDLGVAQSCPSSTALVSWYQAFQPQTAREAVHALATRYLNDNRGATAHVIQQLASLDLA